MTDTTAKDYDIGLSLAGDDREKVECVLLELAKRNVRCFYDRIEVAQLWGKDLSGTLSDIYTKRCRYFVPFISAAYVSKVWPKYEFRSALQRAIRSDETFILPIRLDDSPFELLNENVFYLDLRHTSAAEIADAVVAKLGYNVSTQAPQPSKASSTSPAWDFKGDFRVQRHRNYVSAQYPNWTGKPRLTLLVPK